MPVRLIVLAAGKGTRMKSALPKVLHRLAGKPLLAHVLDTAGTLAPASMTVVVGHGAERVRETIPHDVHWALQAEQLGTGHAVGQGLEGIEDDDTVLITYGDVPLTRASTYQALVDACDAETLGLLTLMMEDPTGYGRVLREGGRVVGVVEQKDASDDQLGIHEVNAGVVAIRGGALRELVGRIGNDNAQGEYYLTDIFALAVRHGLSIAAVHPGDAWEVDGVNSRVQLARLERTAPAERRRGAHVRGGHACRSRETRRARHAPRRHRQRDRRQLRLRRPLRDRLERLHRSELHDHRQHDRRRGDRPRELGARGRDGGRRGERRPVRPVAPGHATRANTKVGNFVEIKNASLGTGSKANHLSYVGDSEVGTGTNIGAGTITANYDGANKHVTRIGDGASIGSNAVLVAPVSIGDGATVGAGSTIGRDVPPDTLALTRAEQRHVDGWRRPVKKPKG